MVTFVKKTTAGNVKTKPPREAVNPRTGETVKVGGGKKPVDWAAAQAKRDEQSRRAALRAAGGAGKTITIKVERPTAAESQDGLLYAAILDDMDRRIEDIAVRTDRLMARAALPVALPRPGNS